MSNQSPLLGLPYLQPAQAQKHVTHNEALRRLDALVQLSVDELEVVEPPTSPVEGARYLLGDGATGSWSGHDQKVAIFADGSWQFYPPAPGWVAYLRGSGTLVAFDGARWGELTAADPSTLGVNATADNQTRLVVASEGTLFTHDGSDHRLKINKSESTNTASMLFQTDFEGRAEMGLTGEEAFSIKVSDDGVNWRTALQFDPATAGTTGEAVQQSSDDATPGRLMLAEHGVLRSEIIGSVTQSGGLPTGAIIERSTTASGNFVKWADGTVMMSRTVTVDINTTNVQDFAYPDAIATVLGGGFVGADAGEAQGVGSVPRREAMAKLAIWTDAAGWRIRLSDEIADDTLQVNLTVFGLWF
ncbi:MAG: DUF2793 domain-containing protein [Pseudomonadota bacterium]